MDASSQPNKSERALTEERILAFWKERNIFEKTLEQTSNGKEFIFYEGPPTANAKPALHHLEARVFKDVIPRYKTMQGYHVRRRAGWDTHGLPVELQIEKKLGLVSKKEIEQYGIAAFNKECRESVFTYIKDWELFTDRIGYWIDKEDAYYTFDNNYIESLWNILETVEKRGLLYKDYKVVPWCPRCGTTLSSHELGQPDAYQDVKDLSVYAKFKVKGRDDTYIVAWTTTPWTLPGNVALAVGKDIEYATIKKDGEMLILAKDRLSVIEGAYDLVETVSGASLVGLEYEPLYPYLTQLLPASEQEKLQHAYKVYAADFVTTTDGTGVVHTAVMYGADDFSLGTTVGLPKFHLVDESGRFIKGTGTLEGMLAKDKEDNGLKTAVEVLKYLQERGLLLKKENYMHSYPHCWRCKTPLIYYARDSWYIAMSKLQKELVTENEGINWEPAHIRDGRFGEWLREVKDWAISRERYWGTPLPVWQSTEGDRLTIDSIETLKRYMRRSGNSYIVMRHGETENNVKNIWSCDSSIADPLTEKGERQVKAAAKNLKDIDLIIASPFPRTQQTAQLIAEVVGLPKERIISDERLGEWKVGATYDHQPMERFFEVRNASVDRYHFKTADGESYADIYKRVGEFIYELEATERGKKILIISHGAVTRALTLLSEGSTFSTMLARSRSFKNFDNAEVRTIDFAPLPHNEMFELDLHRPYIDEVVLEKDGKEFRRVKEVMDVWFDSGSMPFAQMHYPFAFPKHGLFGKRDKLPYPADFISEAIDQTRGWFYTLHAVGVLMGYGKAYKNVICLGHILDSEGKKMSKSVGNIVDPREQIDKYGVDTLRLWMYAVNQPGDSKNYDEKTVVELGRQVFGLLYNVLSFYELYRDAAVEADTTTSDHVLDRWIMARLEQFTMQTTSYLDAYKLFEPVRGIREFIDDLSTWYLRRSRERIKNSDAGAKQTLYAVLKRLSVLLAPFAPFAAEDMWQRLRHDTDKESVHLMDWPEANKVNEKAIENMNATRELCTIGNALRKKENIPVKQPLLTLHVANLSLDEAHLALIRDELNVKHIQNGNETKLDTTITDELKAEGEYRELIREIQDLRKSNGLKPGDAILLKLPEQKRRIAEPFMEDLKKIVQAKSVMFEEIENAAISLE